MPRLSPDIWVRIILIIVFTGGLALVAVPGGWLLLAWLRTWNGAGAQGRGWDYE